MNRKIDLDGMIKDYKESTLDEVFVEEVLDDLNDLKKFYKPLVPQFVAEWYEKNKDNFDYNLWNYVSEWEDLEECEFKNWFNNSNKAFQTLVNMHQFGYEVKKEKKYRVKVKGLETNSSFLNFNKVHNDWIFSSIVQSDIYQVYHTRKELEEAGFGLVFDNPMFEVKEVECGGNT